MATLREWRVTTVCELIKTKMLLVINEDDKVDIWSQYLKEGIQFSDWGGSTKVIIHPILNSCCEEIFVKYERANCDTIESTFRIVDVDKFIKAAYTYIQVTGI